MRHATLLCLALGLSAQIARADGPRVLTREQVVEAVLRATPPHLREAALAKLRDVPAARVVRDGSDPGLRSVLPNALSCATPCTEGILEIQGDQFDAFVDCAIGTFTVRTGRSHPHTLVARERQSLLFAGVAGDPRGANNTWHLHGDDLDITDPLGGMACVFDPPDTPNEPNSLGLEVEWTVPIVAGLDLVLREEIVVFGTNETDGGVRLTLGAANPSSSIRNVFMGVRWFLDGEMAYDDGVAVASTTCAPFATGPEVVVEHELTGAEVQEFIRWRNDDTGPSYEAFLACSARPGFADTGTPSRYVHGAFSTVQAAIGDWGYVPTEGTDARIDGADLFYHGATLADAVTLDPGQSFTRSAVFLTDCDQVYTGPCVPPDMVAVAMEPMACSTAPVHFSATITVPGRGGTFGYEWDFGDTSPRVPVASPLDVVEHVYGQVGSFGATLVATDAIDVACTSTSSPAVVTLDAPVLPMGVATLDAALRLRKIDIPEFIQDADLELLWPTAAVDPPGFVVLRDESAAEPWPSFADPGEEVGRTTELTLVHLNGLLATPLLAFYHVLPTDSCGGIVFPP
jgi:hypothetical protein